VTIGQVAAACGYTDHAHLIRDVTALAGCTPTELVVGHVPFVQDVETAGR
jgi:AraC-like DNA-binding protein